MSILIPPFVGAPAAAPSGGSLAVDEGWLREPRLLVPGMQPLGLVRIDATHSLGRACVFCDVGGASAVNARSKIAEHKVPNKITIVSPGARARVYDGTNDSSINSGSPIIAGTSSNITVFVIANYSGVADGGYWVKVGNSIGPAIGIGATTMDADGNNLIGLLEGVAWIPTGVTIPAGTNSAAIVVTGTNSTQCYLNGVAAGSASGSTMGTIDAAFGVFDISFGANWLSLGRASAVDIVFAAIFLRAMTAREIADLHIDPYQFLIPA